MKKLWDEEEAHPGSVVSTENIRTVMRFPSNSPLEGIDDDDIISVRDLQQYAESRSSVVRERLQTWKAQLAVDAERTAQTKGEEGGDR